MSESSSTSSASENVRPAATKGSSVRLIVLLVILAIMVGAYLVDNIYMYNQVKAAQKRIDEAHQERATQSFEAGKNRHFLAPEDIKEVIGFGPSDTKESEVEERPVLKEYYRWWGPLLPNRRFIEVSYRPGAEEGQWRYDSYEVANDRLFGSDEDEVMEEPVPAGEPPTGSEAGPAPPVGPMGPIGPPMPMGEGSGDATPPPSDSDNTEASSDSSK